MERFAEKTTRMVDGWLFESDASNLSGFQPDDRRKYQQLRFVTGSAATGMIV